MPIFDSGYPKNTNPDGDDYVLTTDTSDSSAVKGVSLTSIKNWLAGLSKWVTSAMIADEAVDTPQLADKAATEDKIDWADIDHTTTVVDLSNKSISSSSASIGQLTIPSTGLYIVSASIRISDQSYIISYLLHNSSTQYSYGQIYNSGTGLLSTLSMPLTMYFTAGDTIDFFVQGSGSSTTQAANVDRNYIRAVKIMS